MVAQSLLAHEMLAFYGAAETDGSFNVRGGRGDDTITTGAGNDQLWGNLGADRLSGGAGNDSFEYYAVGESTSASRDQILDFGAGDKINLSNIDANGNAADGDSSFIYLGLGEFTGVAGQVRLIAAGTDWLIEADTDGDGLADLIIDVTTTGGYVPSSGDFYL